MNIMGILKMIKDKEKGLSNGQQVNNTTVIGKMT